MRRSLVIAVLLFVAVGLAVALRACVESDPQSVTSGAERTVDAVPRERRRARQTTAVSGDAESDREAIAGAEDDAASDGVPKVSTSVRAHDEELRLPRRYLSGIVVDVSGAPIEFASVRLISRWLPANVARRAAVVPVPSSPSGYEPAPSIPRMTARVWTTADGRFRLPYVVGDYLRLHVLEGNIWMIVEDRHVEQRIVVATEKPAVHVRIVRAADGVPVEGAEVVLSSEQQLYPSSRRFRVVGRTQTNGRATLQPFFGGVAHLDVSAPDLGSVSRLPVELSPVDVTDIVVELLSEYPIRGRVVDAETDRPIAGAQIGYSVPIWWAREPPVETDSDGRFEFHGFARVANSSRPIGVRAPGYVPFATWLPSELPPSGVREVEIRLVRGGALRMRCVDRAGRPVERAFVYAKGESARDRRGHDIDIADGGVWTRADGVASIGDLPNSADPVEVRIFVHGVEVMRRKAPSPAAGETVDLGDVVVESGRVLTGRIVTAAGTPAAGMTVMVMPDDPEDEFLYELASAALDVIDTRHATADAAGYFAIAGLAPGLWNALAWVSGDPRPPRLVRGIVIAADSDPPAVTIRLPRPAVVEGVLLDAARSPLVDTEITTLLDLPVPFSLNVSTRTDARGRFRIEGFSADGGRVWVEARGAFGSDGDYTERGTFVTPGAGPVELRVDRLGPFDPDDYDKAMGR